MAGWIVRCYRDQVQGIDVDVSAVETQIATRRYIVEGTHDLEVGHFCIASQILAITRLRLGRRDAPLQQLILQAAEERRFVITQVRLDEIFRKQEYFAIGFPDAVILAPE